MTGKDARIVTELSQYLSAILPSTVHEVVSERGRHGVRMHLAQYRLDFLLADGWWTPHFGGRPYPGKPRIPVTRTYPLLTIDIASVR